MNRSAWSWAKALGVAAFAAVSVGVQAFPVTSTFATGDDGWTFQNPGVGVATPGHAVTASDNNSVRYNPNTDTKPNSMSRSFSLASNHTYTLDFFLQGTLANLTVSFGGLTGGTPDDTVADGDWTNYFFDFTGPTSGDVEFVFSGTNRILIDDITISDQGCTPGRQCGGTVPEPGSLLLVGAALAGLGLIRRRMS